MIRFFKVFILFIFCSSFSAFSQTWEIGLTAGGMGYMGDLNQTNPIQVNGLAFGGMVKRNLSPYWAIKAGILSGEFGDYSSVENSLEERSKGLSFLNKINEASLQVEFNFLKYGFGFKENKFSPYLFAGVSIAEYNPTFKYLGLDYDLRFFKTEGQEQPYKNTTYAIPYGAGLKFNFGRYFNLTGELGYRNTTTDYLDDVSGYYPTATQLRESTPEQTDLRTALSYRSKRPYELAGTQRGDFKKKDTYLFVGITLSYTFVSQKCPF